MSFPALGVAHERIGKAAFRQLVLGVNDQIAIVEAEWTTDDSDLATLLGRPFGPITVERIAKANMHYGHIPSLVEAPIGKYPNLAVFAYDSKTAPGWADQEEAENITFYVEVMCKSETDEETVNARISRTVDAVDRTLMVDQTLGGVCLKVFGQTKTISDVFKRSEVKGRGSDFWWQGARLEYQVQRPVLY